MSRFAHPVILLAMLAACGDPQPGDDTGADRFQTSDATAVQGRIGAHGNAATATHVVASTWTGDGESRVLGEAEVDASGAYLLEFDGDEAGSLILVTAFDAQGQVVGNTMAEADGDETVDASPMTDETSLEAGIFAELVASGDAGEASWSSVRALISADIAAAFYGEASDTADEMAALTVATEAAVSAEAEAWADAGLDLTAAADARLEAAAEYTDALADGDDAAEAEAAFEASIEAIFEAEGADAYDQAELASRVGLVFRTLLDAHGASEATTEAAARQSLQLEAELWTDAMVTLLEGGEDTEGAIDAVVDAGADLSLWLDSATSTEEMDQAVASYRAEIEAAASLTFQTEADEHGTLLSELLDLDNVLDVVADLAVEVDLWLDGELQSASEESASGAIDAEAAASVMVDAWLEARDELEAAIDDQLGGEASTSLAVQLLVASEGSFQHID